MKMMIKSQNVFKKLALASAVAGLFTLSACGGGGDSTNPATTSTISGTAAGGAAVVGTVYIKDSLGAVKTGVIEANGHYEVDVTGMTGPFMLKADGSVGTARVSYYSAATSADAGGTINITPLTSLLVANVAGQLAETYYSNPANFNGITADKLVAAQVALQAKLKPILDAMGLDASINLLRTSFAADHSGLDELLDMIKLESDANDANKINIINRLTGLTVASDSVTSATDDAEVATLTQTEIDALTAAKGTPQAAAGLLASLAAKFASGVPSESDLNTLLDSTQFLDNGQTISQLYNDLNDPAAVGMTFSNVVVTPVAGNPNRIALDFVWNSPKNTDPLVIERLFADNSSGSWKLIGNQRKAHMYMHASASVSEDGVTNVINPIENGLTVEIDPSAWNGNHGSGPLIDHAQVTGPGLPQGGVKMVMGTQEWLVVSGASYETNHIKACDSPNAVPAACVTVASTIDNGEYTVTLHQANGGVINGDGDHVFLPKKPIETSALTPAMFPEITSVTVDGSDFTLMSQLVANANMAVGWTMPTTLKANRLSVGMSGEAFSNDIGTELVATDASKIISLGADQFPVPTNAWVWLRGYDAHGRAFEHLVYAY